MSAELMKGLDLRHWKGQGWEVQARGKMQLRRREVLYMHPVRSVDSLNKPRGNGLKLGHTAAKCSDLGHTGLRRSLPVPVSFHQHSLNSQLPGRKTVITSLPCSYSGHVSKFWPMGCNHKCQGWGGAVAVDVRAGTAILDHEMTLAMKP